MNSVFVLLFSLSVASVIHFFTLILEVIWFWIFSKYVFASVPFVCRVWWKIVFFKVYKNRSMFSTCCLYHCSSQSPFCFFIFYAKNFSISWKTQKLMREQKFLHQFSLNKFWLWMLCVKRKKEKKKKEVVCRLELMK